MTVHKKLERDLINAKQKAESAASAKSAFLANLVGNAVKFTEKGQILLQAHYGDGLLSITVSDTGIGIAPEAQSVVFEECGALPSRRLGLPRRRPAKRPRPGPAGAAGARYVLVLEAVEQARLADDPFDMILMDLHLPGMDGCDAAQSVRKAGFDGKQLPIIAVTANAFGEDVERCLSAGMQGHIAKPVRLRFLQKMLAQY